MPHLRHIAEYLYGLSSQNRWTIRSEEQMGRTTLMILRQSLSEELDILPPNGRIRTQHMGE
jgi:hypothetical protein